MIRAADETIHTVEIPVSRFSLMVPSASIAEIVNVSEMTPIPLTQHWVRGAIGWRMLGVPVVSFETLVGGGALRDPSPGSKIVIFYPMQGRAEWEFYGILSSSEPRPHTVNSGASFPALASELPDTPFVAAGIKVGGRLMLIPDTEALRQAFYP